MQAARVIDLLKARGWWLATAESCTAGLIAAAVTDVAGSSSVFDRGFVTYSNRAKIEMLDVRAQTLAAHGAVSEEVAREMAQGARQKAGVDIAISVTGIAGPGGSEHKPEGRVCFALSTAHETTSETVEFGAIGRSKVRQATVEHTLGMLEQQLSLSA